MTDRTTTTTAPSSSRFHGRDRGEQTMPQVERDLEEIRNRYAKPAHLGGRIRYTGNERSGELGVITGATGLQLLVRLEGREKAEPLHPAYSITYL